jgi:hypothetical protein
MNGGDCSSVRACDLSNGLVGFDFANYGSAGDRVTDFHCDGCDINLRDAF